MEPTAVDDFLRKHAPADVRATVSWLTDDGFVLTSVDGDSAFSARFGRP